MSLSHDSEVIFTHHNGGGQVVLYSLKGRQIPTPALRQHGDCYPREPSNVTKIIRRTKATRYPPSAGKEFISRKREVNYTIA